MQEPDPFADLTHDEQTHLAEREMASFIAAVRLLYGSEQAELSAMDWLNEALSIDGAPFDSERGWRSVSVAASARLASRLAKSMVRRS